MSSDPALVLSVTELESTSEVVVKPQPIGKKNTQKYEHEHGHSHGHGHSHNGEDNHGFVRLFCRYSSNFPSRTLH